MRRARRRGQARPPLCFLDRGKRPQGLQPLTSRCWLLEAGVRVVPAGLDAEATEDASQPPDLDERVVADQAVAAENRFVLPECRCSIEPAAGCLLAEKPAGAVDE